MTSGHDKLNDDTLINTTICFGIFKEKCIAMVWYFKSRDIQGIMVVSLHEKVVASPKSDVFEYQEFGIYSRNAEIKTIPCGYVS